MSSTDDLKKLLRSRTPTNSYVGKSAGAIKGGKVSVQTEHGAIKATAIASLQPGACWVFQGNDSQWYAAGPENEVKSDRVVVQRRGGIENPTGLSGQVAVLFAKLVPIGPGAPEIDCECPRFFYVSTISDEYPAGYILEGCGGMSSTPEEAAFDGGAPGGPAAANSRVTIFLSTSGDVWDHTVEFPSAHDPEIAMKGVGFGYGVTRSGTYKYISPDLVIDADLGIPFGAAQRLPFNFENNEDPALRVFENLYYNWVWSANEKGARFESHYSNWVRIAGMMDLDTGSIPSDEYESQREAALNHHFYYIAPIEGAYLRAGTGHAIAMLRRFDEIEIFREGLEAKTGNSWVLEYAVLPSGAILPGGEDGDGGGSGPLPPVLLSPLTKFRVDFYIGGDRPVPTYVTSMNASEPCSYRITQLSSGKVLFMLNKGLKNDTIMLLSSEPRFIYSYFNLSTTNNPKLFHNLVIDKLIELGEIDESDAHLYRSINPFGHRPNPADTEDAKIPTEWCAHEQYTIFPDGTVIPSISPGLMAENWQVFTWSNRYLMPYQFLPYTGSASTAMFTDPAILAHFINWFDPYYRLAIETYDLPPAASFFLDNNDRGFSFSSAHRLQDGDLTCIANVQYKNRTVVLLKCDESPIDSGGTTLYDRYLQDWSNYDPSYGSTNHHIIQHQVIVGNMGAQLSAVAEGLRTKELNVLKTENTKIPVIILDFDNFKRKKDIFALDPFFGFFYPSYFSPELNIVSYGGNHSYTALTASGYSNEKRNVFTYFSRKAVIRYPEDLYQEYRENYLSNLYGPKVHSTIRMYGRFPAVDPLPGDPYDNRFHGSTALGPFATAYTEVVDMRESVINRAELSATSLGDPDAIILAVSPYIRGRKPKPKRRPFYIPGY